MTSPAGPSAGLSPADSCAGLVGEDVGFLPFLAGGVVVVRESVPADPLSVSVLVSGSVAASPSFSP